MADSGVRIDAGVASSNDAGANSDGGTLGNATDPVYLFYTDDKIAPNRINSRSMAHLFCAEQFTAKVNSGAVSCRNQFALMSFAGEGDLEAAGVANGMPQQGIRSVKRVRSA